MFDATLASRLKAAAATPTLVLWGDSDRIADTEYGRAFAAAIPGAEFRVLANTGHLPQIETPDQLLEAIWTFAEATGVASGNCTRSMRPRYVVPASPMSAPEPAQPLGASNTCV